MLATVLDIDVWLTTLVNDLEGKVLHIGLNLGIGEFTTNETLGIEDTREGYQRVDRGVRRQKKTHVLYGFVTALFFAESPIRRPVSEKETYDGVVLLP